MFHEHINESCLSSELDQCDEGERQRLSQREGKRVKEKVRELVRESERDRESESE